jgi:hypothetical protein
MEVKKHNFKLGIIAAILLICMILIPVTSSVSVVQQQSFPATVQTEIAGTSGMSTAEIVGISAAVVSSGVFIAATTDNNSSAQADYHN